ncbi:MAG: FAD-dependent monooxygenase [Yoonia sp.]|nr:FAD-dependent monooxygenase [Yoonia sp.]
MTKPRQSVVIVGAGIGGLTAALAFARNGAEVFVLEQASELKEVGAGIQITPNGARVLNALGLVDACAAQSIAAQAVQPMDALTGRPVTRFDLTTRSPAYRFYHRASLQSMLANAAQKAGVGIRLGQRVTSVTAQGTVDTSAGPLHADIVVGADGIHSVTRDLFGGPKAAFTGQVAWRDIVVATDAPAQAQIWMAPHRHVVTYPLKGGLLNVVAVQERADWAAEGWDHSDDPMNLRSAFSDCAPDLQAILAQTKAPSLWGLFRHPVAPVWSKGNVALLGDAAHPTLPFLAQGANLAIEDAYVLARCCAEQTSVPSAFRRYQQLRRDRVVRAIAAANANAQNYHLSGIKRSVAFAGLKALGAVAPNAFINRLGWLYDHDVTR